MLMLQSGLQIGNSRTTIKKRGTAECAGNTATGQRNCVTVAGSKLLPFLLEVLVVFCFFLFEMSKLMQSGVKKSDVLWWVHFALICVKIFSKLHLFPHCGNSHFMLLTHTYI